jgi:hypothetical protein
MPTDPWEERLARSRAEAARFDALLGRWEGRGTAHGQPTAGSLVVERLLDGSLVGATERTGDHEDRCIYRFEPDNGGFCVLHLMAGAMVREYPVEFTARGFVWITPPGEPAVEWTRTDDGWTCDVVWPGDQAPEVSMRWTRTV